MNLAAFEGQVQLDTAPQKKQSRRRESTFGEIGPGIRELRDGALSWRET
ncbi:hypothetical protein [Mesorhizobium sp. M8A.F.Ca.ET.181.01.1.1]|nr:hypothetical protein [Mesorhizobium sp. M8A.F.Ca.ET.181.01.1.1]